MFVIKATSIRYFFCGIENRNYFARIRIFSSAIRTNYFSCTNVIGYGVRTSTSTGNLEFQKHNSTSFRYEDYNTYKVETYIKQTEGRKIMEMTDCDRCKYRKGCILAWDYGSLYCNDYEEEENEEI